jgi:hypothetical protein
MEKKVRWIKEYKGKEGNIHDQGDNVKKEYY